MRITMTKNHILKLRMFTARHESIIANKQLADKVKEVSNRLNTKAA